MIRPVLKKKYQTLCNISVPINSELTGDDVSKDIKSCDSLISLGKEQYQRANTRCRGRVSFKRGSYGYNNQSTSRYMYQPYPGRGEQRTWNRNYRIQKKSVTATATSPNDQLQ